MPPFANVIEDAFSPLISAFESVMVFIHDHLVGGSWGLAIVGLTVVIRALLVPLTFRQLKSMQEMQRLAPQVQALKEKYKDDKQRQQQEIMNFYREHKINPLASCLPLLLQLPVFISLFYMLRTDLKKHICPTELVHKYNELHHTAIAHVGGLPSKYIEKTSCDSVAPHSAKFLFLPDITNKATGAALVVLIVLYVASQVASTLVATATADPNQRRIMLVLPVVFVLFLYKFPAGLLVYWITTNTWTIGQQLLIKRHMGSIAPPGAADSDGRLPDGKAKAPAGEPRGEPALAGVGGASGGSASSGSSSSGGSTGGSGRRSAPPPPPRKKKKRSGRRR
jgi:YidC/Oxa1 family membrane protein insertase